MRTKEWMKIFFAMADMNPPPQTDRGMRDFFAKVDAEYARMENCAKARRSK